MGGLLHLVQRGGVWAGLQPAQASLLAVPNVTSHPSTASVPITVLLYNGPLLCGFNVQCAHCKVPLQCYSWQCHSNLYIFNNNNNNNNVPVKGLTGWNKRTIQNSVSFMPSSQLKLFRFSPSPFRLHNTIRKQTCMYIVNIYWCIIVTFCYFPV